MEFIAICVMDGNNFTIILLSIESINAMKKDVKKDNALTITQKMKKE